MIADPILDVFPGLPMGLGSLSGFVVNVVVHSVQSSGFLAAESILSSLVVDPGCRRMNHYLSFGKITIGEQIRYWNSWGIGLLLNSTRLPPRFTLLLLLLRLFRFTTVLNYLGSGACEIIMIIINNLVCNTD